MPSRYSTNSFPSTATPMVAASVLPPPPVSSYYRRSDVPTHTPTPNTYIPSAKISLVQPILQTTIMRPPPPLTTTIGAPPFRLAEAQRFAAQAPSPQMSSVAPTSQATTGSLLQNSLPVMLQHPLPPQLHQLPQVMSSSLAFVIPPTSTSLRYGPPLALQPVLQNGVPLKTPLQFGVSGSVAHYAPYITQQSVVGLGLAVTANRQDEGPPLVSSNSAHMSLPLRSSSTYVRREIPVVLPYTRIGGGTRGRSPPRDLPREPPREIHREPQRSGDVATAPIRSRSRERDRDTTVRGYSRSSAQVFSQSDWRSTRPGPSSGSYGLARTLGTDYSRGQFNSQTSVSSSGIQPISRTMSYYSGGSGPADSNYRPARPYDSQQRGHGMFGVIIKPICS